MWQQITVKNWQNLPISKPKPDLQINAHTKFSENPLIYTQVIIWKWKYGPTYDRWMFWWKYTCVWVPVQSTFVCKMFDTHHDFWHTNQSFCMSKKWTSVMWLAIKIIGFLTQILWNVWNNTENDYDRWINLLDFYNPGWMVEKKNQETQ